MGQNYSERCATVEAALTQLGVEPPTGKDLAAVAVAVLAALDGQRENIR